MLVYEQDNSAVKAPGSQALSFQNNGFLSEEFNREQRDRKFRSRNLIEPGQCVSVIASFRAGAVEAVADRLGCRRQKAHQAESADSTARIASKVNDGAFGIGKLIGERSL